MCRACEREAFGVGCDESCGEVRAAQIERGGAVALAFTIERDLAADALDDRREERRARQIAGRCEPPRAAAPIEARVEQRRLTGTASRDDLAAVQIALPVREDAHGLAFRAHEVREHPAGRADDLGVHGERVVGFPELYARGIGGAVEPRKQKIDEADSLVFQRKAKVELERAGNLGDGRFEIDARDVERGEIDVRSAAAGRRRRELRPAEHVDAFGACSVDPHIAPQQIEWAPAQRDVFDLHPDAGFIRERHAARAHRAEPCAAHALNVEPPKAPHALAVGHVIDDPRTCRAKHRDGGAADERGRASGDKHRRACAWGQFEFQNACPSET